MAGRGEGLRRSSSGTPPASTTGGSSTASPRASTFPTRGSAWARRISRKEGPATYVLAVSEYREFLTLYPSHPKSDYAQFQTAEAYYLQKNGPDRDQTNTTKALDEYERLLDLYPNSKYVEIARLRVANLRQYLAKAEYGAGYFYQKTRKALRSAIDRYEGILTDYPDYAGMDEVLYRLSECLTAAARKAEALPHLNRLLAEYPNSKFAPEAPNPDGRVGQAGGHAAAPFERAAAAGPPPEKPTP